MKKRSPDDTTGRPGLLAPIVALGAIIGVGGLALYHLGGGRWSLEDALFFALICASTVGLYAPEGLADVPYARFTTAIIILASLGAVAYVQSILTGYLLEGIIGAQLKGRRMEKKIAGLKDHVIVCGAGSVGVHVIEELLATGTPFVIVDQRKETYDDLARELGTRDLLVILGDATSDATLLSAGIERASGIIAALTEDRDNLYVTLTARELNDAIRIVAKVVHPEAIRKMERAGANATVAPSRMGGLRMASEMVRPTTAAFFDRVMHGREHRLRVDEIEILGSSSALGKRLKDLTMPERDLVILGIFDGKNVLPAPPPDMAIEAGHVIIVVGSLDAIGELREEVAYHA